ncbi:MAG: hypothetical protein B7Y02_04240, partial [Rhodobacterales bacterium 17-64-5]
ALFPLPVMADCLPGGQVFSCQIGAKTLEVCNETETLIYSFGPPGAPELLIAEPLASVAFQPWPGVGSSIWESVTFTNQGYSYEVVTSVERDSTAPEDLQGAVYVLQNDSIVAELTCDPGTASNSLDVVWDLKESIGQCYEFASQSWQYTCNN